MNKRRTTVWLPVELVERMKKFTAKTGMPFSELLRRAVVEYLKRRR